ncbi:MAG: sigma-70 family RNA polymerase sigma factor [Sporichthyaceae bacterium]
MDEHSALDDEQFRKALQEEIPRLRRLASRVAGSSLDPDDLTQDALERAWRSRASFRADSAMSTWLHRIVVNRARDLAVRTEAIPVAEIPEQEAFSFELADPADLVARAEDVDTMRAALSRLSVQDRLILALHDGEGWTVPQIAESCGLETAAAHKRLQRGRFRLAKELAVPIALTVLSSHECLEVRSLAAAYLDGALDDAGSRTVEEHLRTCERCPPVAQAVIGLREVLRSGGQMGTLHADVSRLLRATAVDEPSV